MKHYIPCLSIAGCDPSGGAGIEADLKTFSALGTYGMAVITALTAQNTVGVRKSYEVASNAVTEQAEAVFDDINPQFVKIGMTFNSDIIRAIAGILRRYKPKYVVLDPVMVSTSGHKLINDEAIEVLKAELIPLATIITPNLPESAALLNKPLPANVECVNYGRELLSLGCKSVLVKGGHLEDSATDVLVTEESAEQFDAPKIDTRNTHGTGCTLLSAITAYLARGCTMSEAVAKAKTYLYNAILSGSEVALGHGNGPVNHFFKPDCQFFNEKL